MNIFRLFKTGELGSGRARAAADPARIRASPARRQTTSPPSCATRSSPWSAAMSRSTRTASR